MSENNKVTLSSLSEGAIPTATPQNQNNIPTKLPKFNSNEVREVDRRVVSQPSERERPVEDTGNPMIDQAFKSVDPTIERLRQESIEEIEKGEQERLDTALNNDDDFDLNSIKSPSVYKVNTFDEGGDVSYKTVEDRSEIRNETQITTKQQWSDNKEDETLSEIEEEIIPIMFVPIEDEKEQPNEDPVTMSINNTTFNTHIDDEDMDLLDDDDDETEIENEPDDEDSNSSIKEKEIREKIRQEMSANFNPISHKIDLSKFTVSKKPIGANKVVSDISNKPIECADGVIMSEKRAIRMSAFSPTEIQSLDPSRIRNGNVNAYMRNKMNLIYQHLIDENKPKSFEAWAKVTPNTALDDYYFTAYKATFGNSNILTYNCSDNDCSNVFMKSVPINQMIKFRDDKIKDEYYNILRYGSTNSGNNKYKVGLYQASDNYVFGLKQPSLYNTFIEITLVDDKFMKKYEDLLLIMSYIDCVYLIDLDTSQLIPVDTRPIPNDPVKTYKRKIKTFAAIINTLDSDQLQALSMATDEYDGGKMNDNGTLEKDVTYIYPSITCPKCGKTINEQEVAPDNILFTRHQLGLMSRI